MIKLYLIVLPASLLISGCASVEAKILDLGGFIFIFFTVILSLQLYSEKLTEIRIVVKIQKICSSFIPILSPGLFVIGLMMFVHGVFFSENLGKLNIFNGIIFIVLGWLLKQYYKESDKKKKSKYLTPIFLCLNFAIVFFFLKFFAADSLKL